MFILPYVNFALPTMPVLSKLCVACLTFVAFVACRTMVCRQLDVKQYLRLAIYSFINYIIGVFKQQYKFCKQQYNKKFCPWYFKGFCKHKI